MHAKYLSGPFLTPLAEIAATATRAQEMMQKKAFGTITEHHNTPNHYLGSTTTGIPTSTTGYIVGKSDALQSGKSIQIMPKNTLFRHYTEDSTRLVQILHSQLLIPGSRPFIPVRNNLHTDLVGAFLTTPEFSAESVGVPDYKFYVDLMLYAGTGILKIDTSNKYFLIPGIPITHDITIQAYEAWVQHDRPTTQECHKLLSENNYSELWHSVLANADFFVEIDKDSGFPAWSRIPIKVVKIGTI